MSQDLLQSLASSIDSGRLVDSKVLSIEDPDAALDRRDSPEFEAPWLRIYSALSTIEQKANLGADAQDRIDLVRKAAFMAVYRGTETAGFTELAPAISDDFDLIARALSIGFSDPWLNALFLSYSTGEFPCCHLEGVPGTLSELVADYLHPLVALENPYFIG